MIEIDNGQVGQVGQVIYKLLYKKHKHNYF